MAQASEESNTDVIEDDAKVEHTETILVSMQDFTRILDLLKHPPPPNDRLKAAIEALPETL